MLRPDAGAVTPLTRALSGGSREPWAVIHPQTRASAFHLSSSSPVLLKVIPAIRSPGLCPGEGARGPGPLSPCFSSPLGCRNQRLLAEGD